MILSIFLFRFGENLHRNISIYQSILKWFVKRFNLQLCVGLFCSCFVIVILKKKEAHCKGETLEPKLRDNVIPAVFLFNVDLCLYFCI